MYDETKLKRIGKCWFIVYSYYKLIDSSELRWKTDSINLRTAYYKSLENNVLEIAEECKNLRTYQNSLGVTKEEIIKMADELIIKLKKEKK